jgi:hypothetical protein
MTDVRELRRVVMYKQISGMDFFATEEFDARASAEPSAEEWIRSLEREGYRLVSDKQVRHG